MLLIVNLPQNSNFENSIVNNIHNEIKPVQKNIFGFFSYNTILETYRKTIIQDKKILPDNILVPLIFVNPTFSYQGKNSVLILRKNKSNNINLLIYFFICKLIYHYALTRAYLHPDGCASQPHLEVFAHSW